MREAQFPQNRKTARFMQKSLFAYCGGGLAGCAPPARPQDSKIPRLLIEIILRVWTTRKTARFLDNSSKSSCGCGPPRKTARFIWKYLFASCGGRPSRGQPPARPQDFPGSLGGDLAGGIIARRPPPPLPQDRRRYLHGNLAISTKYCIRYSTKKYNCGRW